MRILFILLCSVVLCACTQTDDDRIESVIDELVASLNNHSLSEAARLYSGGTIPPLNDNGDSSTVFRLLSIPGAQEFHVSDIETVVIDDRARASFRLAATMTHADSAVGEMGMLLRVEMEKSGTEWKIIPGYEKQETGL